MVDLYRQKMTSSSQILAILINCCHSRRIITSKAEELGRNFHQDN
jgi:hypothetical protein